MTTSPCTTVSPIPTVPEVDHPLLPKVQPCPEPIDPAALLAEILATIQRHVIIDPAQAVAVTLWIAMTWFMHCINVAPLLIITAPERACGKSQLLSLALRLVFRGLSAANTSGPFLFRAIQAWQPTILIDEADTFVRESADFKGMINAGHTRDSAYVGRAAGNDGEFVPTLYSVWAAKVLAGIALEKHLPDATMSRGIITTLRRKLPTEAIVRLRHADADVFKVMASKLARFALDYSAQVSNARPDIPEALSDRAQDNWEPLLAIAECAGPEWVAKATSAALVLAQSTDESVSAGNELLADIQEVFSSHGDFKISSAKLIEALVADPESPWATYNRGRPLTPRQLSKMLSAYNIKSKTVRIGPFETPKGYDREQFSDSFSRYLTQDRHDAQELMQDKGSDVADEVQQICHIPGTPPPRHMHSSSSKLQSELEPLTSPNLNAATTKLCNEVVRKSNDAPPITPVTKRPDSAF